jgi:hypothetical protein
MAGFVINSPWQATYNGLELPYLALQPDSAGFAVTEGSTNIAIDLDGGAPRMRADLQGAVSTVNVQWSLSNTQFDFFKAFYRSGIGNGANPFWIKLVGLDSAELTPYQALIVPGSYKPASSQSGLTYVVTAQLWVTPNTGANANDAAILAAGAPA